MDANDLEPEDREPKRPYQPYRFTRAPRAVRRAGVAPDNIAVMPASLLPFKKEGQKEGMAECGERPAARIGAPVRDGQPAATKDPGAGLNPSEEQGASGEDRLDDV